MGSSLSPVIADLVMQDLENEALRTIGIRLPAFYYRYVDDILLAAPENLTEHIVEVFN